MCQQLCWSIFAMNNFPNQFIIAENIYVKIISLHVANKQVNKFTSFFAKSEIGRVQPPHPHPQARVGFFSDTSIVFILKKIMVMLTVKTIYYNNNN